MQIVPFAKSAPCMLKPLYEPRDLARNNDVAAGGATKQPGMDQRRYRHCERSEAIHVPPGMRIVSSPCPLVQTPGVVPAKRRRKRRSAHEFTCTKSRSRG